MSSVSFSSSHLYLTDGALILLALLLALGWGAARIVETPG